MKVQVVRRAVAMGVAVLFACAGVAGAQSLEQLPAESLVVFHVANLGKVGEKSAALSKKLGLDQMSPEAADPLGALEAKLGIKEGINRDGDMAFAYVDPKVTGAGDKSFLFLIPVTDYKAFLGNFDGAKTDGDVTEVTTPEGQPAFAKAWGKYAALSPAKATLSAKPAGVKVAGALAQKELKDKDVVMFANLAMLRPQLLPQIQNNRAKWLAELEKDVLRGPRADRNADPGMDPNDPAAAEEAKGESADKRKKFLPAIKSAANQGINVMEAFARDATSATYSLNLTEAGINGTLAAEFEPGSYLGKTVAGIKGGNGALLSGLPAGKYLFFGGTQLDPKSVAPIFNDLIDPIVKELTAMNDADAKQVIRFADAFKKIIGATTGSTFGALAPTGPVMQEPVIQSITITRGDVKTIEAAQKDMLESQEQLMAMFQGAAGPQTKTTFTPAARQIDGVTFSQFKTEFTGDPSTPESAQAQQMLGILYGPEGMSGLNGQLNDKQMLTVSGLPAASLSGAIKAAKDDKDVLGATEPVKIATAELPQTRIAAFYIPLDVILGTGMNYAKQFGIPVNAQMPENLPPIGITVSTEASALRFDSHVPTPLVQSVVSTIMQVYAGMQGGGGAGPGGPGPGPGPQGDGL